MMMNFLYQRRNKKDWIKSYSRLALLLRKKSNLNRARTYSYKLLLLHFSFSKPRKDRLAT